MKGYPEERAVLLAEHMIQHKSTVRQTAEVFHISKSTVHKDLTQRLCRYNYPLYLKVRKILDENKRERHIRGGMATRKKYKGI